MSFSAILEFFSFLQICWTQNTCVGRYIEVWVNYTWAQATWISIPAFYLCDFDQTAWPLGVPGSSLVQWEQYGEWISVAFTCAYSLSLSAGDKAHFLLELLFPPLPVIWLGVTPLLLLGTWGLVDQTISTSWLLWCVHIICSQTWPIKCPISPVSVTGSGQAVLSR